MQAILKSKNIRSGNETVDSCTYPSGSPRRGFLYEGGNRMNQSLPAEQAIRPDFSTTETVRRGLDELKTLEHELADTPVILVVPIGGDASEFE